MRWFIRRERYKQIVKTARFCIGIFRCRAALFLYGTQMGYLIKYPCHLSLKPMVHIWDIIKNIPSAASIETWDKVGIYQIVSLVWRVIGRENGMSQAVSLWRFGLGYNKKYPFRKRWDITKSVTGESCKS